MSDAQPMQCVTCNPHICSPGFKINNEKSSAWSGSKGGVTKEKVVHLGAIEELRFTHVIAYTEIKLIA